MKERGAGEEEEERMTEPCSMCLPLEMRTMMVLLETVLLINYLYKNLQALIQGNVDNGKGREEKERRAIDVARFFFDAGVDIDIENDERRQRKKKENDCFQFFFAFFRRSVFSIAQRERDREGRRKYSSWSMPGFGWDREAHCRSRSLSSARAYYGTCNGHQSSGAGKTFLMAPLWSTTRVCSTSTSEKKKNIN